MKKLILLMSVSLFFVGCEVEVEGDGTSSDRTHRSIQPAQVNTSGDLQGKIEGQAWSYTHAVAKKSYSAPSEYYLKFYDEAMEEPCYDSPGTNYFTYRTKLEVGKKELSFNNSMIAVVLNNDNTATNLIIHRGSVTIDSVSVDSLEGTIVGVYGNETYVGGKVEIKICN